MKKIIALLLTVALTASIAISGTLAYLTQDAGTQVNTFSVGGIDVTLTEEVGVITNGGGTATKLEGGAAYEGLMPGDQIVKKVSVSNSGDDAYVRVTVTLNNALQINDAIDEVYGDANAQKMYDKIFVGWGLNHGKDLDGDGANDAGMRLTITGSDMPAHVMQVDSVKTIDEYALFYTGNWFGEQEDIVPFDGYYTTGMNPYELKYTYYMFLPEGESTVLFEGFNIPAEFDADQLKMFDGLKITIDADAIQAANIPGADEDVEQKENIEQAKTAFRILNGEVADEWDGTADTSWYNDTDTEFTLSTAEALAGLSELVDDGNNFEGKTIKLASNMDLYAENENGEAICFDPIGSYRNDTAFKGVFDGQGYTISNMSQNTWALDNGYAYGDLGLGLFGKVQDATIKNLNMDEASISGESALCGTVAATAYGNCTFENITVTNSDVADYQYYSGGIVGWASGDHQYINCDVDASTVVAGQWGDFNNANGGIIGGIGASGTYHFKDCDVACVIDVHNDVVSAYQWYTYRRSGMLVGDTGKTKEVDGTTYADAPNVICENVTVTYGDWANYHYCKFSAMSYPWVRVEAGVSCDAYSNIRYGHPTDANGNTVVDDTHVHNDGEAHNELIVFDQLFGGKTGDRYATYGTPTHAGVTVIYNNK